MKLFLAGPMTFLRDFNAGTFNLVTDRLRVWGHQVFNPVEADLAAGFDVFGWGGDVAEFTAATGFDLATSMRRNLLWITGYGEGIALLPGWGDSAGAAIELSTALACGQAAFEVQDTELVELDVAVRHDIETVGYHRLAHRG